MMWPEVLFGFKGRLARLPYFGCSLLCLLLFVIAAFAAFVLFVGSPVIGLVAVLILGGAGAWSGLATSAKRLHDLGLSGLHLVWIVALATSSGAIAETAPVISLVLSIAELIVWLVLLFAPGQPQANQYGPAPA